MHKSPIFAPKKEAELNETVKNYTFDYEQRECIT